MNRITLFGNLTRDPELTTSANGTSICKFSIAVNDKYGETVETDFFDITAFGSRGETIAKYFKKGKKILLEGKVKIRIYEKNGEKRKSIEVILNNFEFVPTGNRDNNNDSNEKTSLNNSKEEIQNYSYGEAIQPEDDDDLPF